MENNLDENDIMQMYEWVDSVNLTRPKKNISRDFSDGVMMAEMIKSHIPKLVELHNYPNASSSKQKKYNWTTLNNKVFKKLGFQLTTKEIDDIIAYKPMVVENLLKRVYDKLQKYKPPVNLDEKNEEIIRTPNQFDDTEDVSKENFYKMQLIERNEIIQQLKRLLDETELKLIKSDQDKTLLTEKLRDYSEKVKKISLA